MRNLASNSREGLVMSWLTDLFAIKRGSTPTPQVPPQLDPDGPCGDPENYTPGPEPEVNSRQHDEWLAARQRRYAILLRMRMAELGGVYLADQDGRIPDRSNAEIRKFL